MATFAEQIQALTGLDADSSSNAFDSTTFQTLVNQWLTSGAKEVIGILPPTMIEQTATRDNLDNSDGLLLGTSDSTNPDTFKKVGKILYVTRNDTNYDYPCRIIGGMHAAMAGDSTNLIYYASETDPVYFIRNNKLEVKPNPTGSEQAYVYYISLPSVLYSESNINNFPAEAEYLVPIYASMRACLYLVAKATVEPTPTGASDLTTTVAITSDQIGTDADFLEYDKWFTSLGEMIEDDEDVELAMTQIEKINSYTAAYNIQVQTNIAKISNYMQSYTSLKSEYAAGIASLKGGGGEK